MANQSSPCIDWINGTRQKLHTKRILVGRITGHSTARILLDAKRALLRRAMEVSFKREPIFDARLNCVRQPFCSMTQTAAMHAAVDSSSTSCA